MSRPKRKSYPVTGPCRSCGKSTSPDPDNDLRGLFWGMPVRGDGGLSVSCAVPIIYCEPCLDQMVAELPDRSAEVAP